MRRGWLSLAVLLGITALFGVGLRNVELKTIFSDLLPKNHEFVKVFKDHPNFGNPLTVTIMVKVVDGDIYNAETLKKIWDMTRDVDLTPGVDHDQILSIATEKARFTEATPEGIDSQPLMGDHPPATPEEIAAFRAAVYKSPNVRNFMISPDGTATLITATFIERLLDYGVVFDALQKLTKGADDAKHDIYMAGQPVLTGWVYHYEEQMLTIFGVTLAALIISLLIYMRNVAGVVGPMMTGLVSAIWGFGFVGWLGQPIEPLIMVVPLLLVARSFSHCVQATERYYEILFHLGDKRKAAEISLAVMMAPGVLGIITDTVGLFLIALAPIPVMERFALFCGFWAIALVPASVFLTPLMLQIMPKPKNIAQIVSAVESEKTGGHGMIRDLLDFTARLTFGKRGWVSAGVIVIISVYSTWVALGLKMGNAVEGSNLLWEDSEFNVAVGQINRHFPGLNTLEVVFEAKGDNVMNRVARKAETVITMNRLQRMLESQESRPTATLSFADYLPEANRLFSGGNPKWAPLDPNDAAIGAAASAVMVGTSPKAFLHVTDFEQRNATVSLWYKDNKQETVDDALARTRAALEEIGYDHKEFTIRLGTGTIALQQSINETVDEYQWTILFWLNLVILITCGLAYRSIVAGIILLIPVNLSNIMMAMLMAHMGIGLDVNTLPIAAIGIGVGIDYGIYLLSRICEEYQQYKKMEPSIVAAVTTTGKAIFFTASIVVVGIMPWYFMSELKFLADMGLLLVILMLINMVSALVMVPLLTWLINPKFVRSEDLFIGEGVDLSVFMDKDAPAAKQAGLAAE